MQEYMMFRGTIIVKVLYDPYENKWETPVEYATKNDLNNAICFNGNASSFRVRSGGTGVKNMYFDMLDPSGNSASIGFLSDGEKGIIFSINNTIVWKLPIN